MREKENKNLKSYYLSYTSIYLQIYRPSALPYKVFMRVQKWINSLKIAQLIWKLVMIDFFLLILPTDLVA